MVRWLLRSALRAGLAVSFVVGCSAEEGAGPPKVNCNVAANPAKVCGKTCTNECGCSDCQPGSQGFIDGVLYVCNGKCLSAASGTGGGGNTGGGGGGNTGGGGGGNTGGSAGAGDGG